MKRVIARYNSATGVLTLDVDGRAFATAPTTVPEPLRATTTTRLGIGCQFNSSGGGQAHHTGRISL